jgi:hypothetical protein
MAQIQTANKKAPMNATSNFSLGFASVSEPTPDRLFDRQPLQRIATVMSLISQAIGFSVLGTLIMLNRHQADLNVPSGNGCLATVGGMSAILLGAAFLVAAGLYCRFRAARLVALPVRRRSAPFHIREPRVSHIEALRSLSCFVRTDLSLWSSRGAV